MATSLLASGRPASPHGIFAGYSVGAKLTALTVALVGIVFIAAIILISVSASSMMTSRSVVQMQNETRSVANMIEMFDHTVNSQVDRFSSMFGKGLPGKFELDPSRTIQIGTQATPALQYEGRDLNLDFTIPDRFTAETGVTATIFARTGDDFVRVTTSLKKENGDRAIGTLLDRAHPGYAALKADKSYSGLATLFGKQYITKYVPLKDATGQIIGVLYVGIDISSDVKALKDKIKELKIGDTGFFYVLNGKEGKDLGVMIAGAPREGKEEGASLLGLKDTGGNDYIKDMLSQKEGVMHYPAQGGDKIIAFTRYPGWNWVIAGEAFTSELTQEVSALRNRYIVFGALFLIGLAVVLTLVVRTMVSRPLDAVRQAADKLAGGDLTTRLHVTRADEIGQLMQAVNGISEGLASVVATVRAGTEQINTAAEEIASGNLDLSSRTEQQAGSLEETASAMEELTSTVKQNAANAEEANTLSGAASDIAAQGGTVVAQVVNTMEAINTSSQKVVDIISVIDSIAFQTNILALNAAVEAARAGEQGRGFAVVASEVRTLAQRSASAAKEIKDLISASVDTVDGGSKQVQQAGATMEEVVASVRRVTNVVSEITHASREQSEGIEQVNKAIAEMDETTQQNAALVEQAAAAAQSLKQQAEQLAAAVSAFRL